MRFDSASIVIASFVLAISFPAFAAEINGKVVAVKDGDSIVILDDDNIEYQVRLSGIDAPERAQPYGQAAKKSLANMVFGQTVSISWHHTDAYERIVGKVVLHGEDINLRQITAGYAWHYRRYQGEQTIEDSAAYTEAEMTARRSKQGLWQQADPTPPWRYRRTMRKAP